MVMHGAQNAYSIGPTGVVSHGGKVQTTTEDGRNVPEQPFDIEYGGEVGNRVLTQHPGL